MSKTYPTYCTNFPHPSVPVKSQAHCGFPPEPLLRPPNLPLDFRHSPFICIRSLKNTIRIHVKHPHIKSFLQTISLDQSTVLEGSCLLAQEAKQAIAFGEMIMSGSDGGAHDKFQQGAPGAGSDCVFALALVSPSHRAPFMEKQMEASGRVSQENMEVVVRLCAQL